MRIAGEPNYFFFPSIGIGSGYVFNRKGSKIVAFSAWQYPFTEEQRRLKQKRDDERKQVEPEGTNFALTKDFFTQLFAGRKKWIQLEKTFCELLLSFFLFYFRASLNTFASFCFVSRED